MACCGPEEGQGPSTDVKDNDLEDTHEAATKAVDDASKLQGPSGAEVGDAIVVEVDARPSAIEVGDARPSAIEVGDARPSATEVVDARPAVGASEVDANPIRYSIYIPLDRKSRKGTELKNYSKKSNKAIKK